MSAYKRTPQTHPKQILKPLTLVEAKKKLMNMVARRDHSEKELRTKLSRCCEVDTIEKTLLWAREQNWLINPEKLKTQLAENLSRRGKGIRKINQKLKNLGLDSIRSDKKMELAKATKLVLAKWSTDDFIDLNYAESQKLKARILRFLISRGYESDIVSLVLKFLNAKKAFKESAADPHPNRAEDNERNDYDEEF